MLSEWFEWLNPERSILSFPIGLIIEVLISFFLMWLAVRAVPVIGRADPFTTALLFVLWLVAVVVFVTRVHVDLLPPLLPECSTVRLSANAETTNCYTPSAGIGGWIQGRARTLSEMTPYLVGIMLVQAGILGFIVARRRRQKR